MEAEPQTLIVGSGCEAREIRYLHDAAAANVGVGVFWLSGFMSDMASTKSAALAEFCVQRGLGYTRFDYAGHGVSGGAFRDGTIGRWLEETRAVFKHVTSGPQIVVGSSMGGHIALLLMRALMRDAPDEARRMIALVLIAPAWDMTEELMWKQFPQNVREEIMRDGVHMRPSNYGQPYMITRDLIEDGRKHLIGGAQLDPRRPVTILQGALDEDVPVAHAHRLVEMMGGGAGVRLIEIPDGEHRLSRPQDLELLFKTIAAFAGVDD